jgi:hypothetical protein
MKNATTSSKVFRDNLKLYQEISEIRRQQTERIQRDLGRRTDGRDSKTGVFLSNKKG